MSLRSYSRLLTLIKNNENAEEVKLIIKKQNLYNAVTSSNNTLLHYAAQSGNQEITKYLIRSGSQVDFQNDLGESPLMLAFGYDYIVKILIEAGANIYMCDNNGNSSLRMVQDFDIDDGFIYYRMFFKQVQIDCQSINEKIAGKLYDAGWILPTILSFIGMKNDEEKYVDLTTMMLLRGCNVNATNNYGLTALHVAVHLIAIDIIKVLLEHNANVNITDLSQRTPLSYVTKFDEYPSEMLKIMRMLIESGANLKNFSDTSYYLLLQNGNREAIELLLQSGLDLSVSDVYGNTAIHCLALNENPEVIELLRGENFNVDARNENDNTPLTFAVFFGIPHAVKFLVEQGADINATCTEENWTALAYSIGSNSAHECTQILLECGANAQTEIGSDQSLTIFDVILEKGKFELGELVIYHLTLQEALGTPLTQLISRQINSNDRFRIYFENSKQHLAKKIFQSVTVLDLLRSSDTKLERYARYRDINTNFKNFIDDGIFNSYYDKILQKRLLKAMQMVELREQAAQVISKLMKVDYGSAYLIVTEIASFLNKEDILNLLKIEF